MAAEGVNDGASARAELLRDARTRAAKLAAELLGACPISSCKVPVKNKAPRLIAAWWEVRDNQHSTFRSTEPVPVGATERDTHVHSCAGWVRWRAEYEIGLAPRRRNLTRDNPDHVEKYA